MGLKFANNASSTLASGITDSDLSLTVASGTGSEFPTLATGDYFYCTLVASDGTMEIVKVTDVTSDTFTIVRAQESTSASAFSAGVKVENRMTAGSFNDMLTAYEASSALPTPVDTEFLGAYSTGTGEWESVSAAELRTDLGGTTVGNAVFTAASATAAQQAMDTEVGVDVQAYDAATMFTDTYAIRTKAHPGTLISVTANTLALDLRNGQEIDWTPTGAAELSAPTIYGSGVAWIRYNYTAAPTLPKATYDGSTWAATGDILIILMAASGDYELFWLNAA